MEAGLQDLEALHAFQFGAKSFSTAPKICSFAAPHASVFTHATTLHKKLLEEVDANWLLPVTLLSLYYSILLVASKGFGKTWGRNMTNC